MSSRGHAATGEHLPGHGAREQGLRARRDGSAGDSGLRDMGHTHASIALARAHDMGGVLLGSRLVCVRSDPHACIATPTVQYSRESYPSSKPLAVRQRQRAGLGLWGNVAGPGDLCGGPRPERVVWVRRDSRGLSAN